MALIRRTEQEFETVKRPSKYPQDEFPLSRMLGVLYHSHGLRASCNLDQVLDPHHTAPMCGCSATHFCFYISYVSLAVFQAEMKSRGSNDPDTSEPRSFHGLINKFQYQDATSEDCEKVDDYCERSGKNFFTLAILMLDDLSVRRFRDKVKPTAAECDMRRAYKDLMSTGRLSMWLVFAFDMSVTIALLEREKGVSAILDLSSQIKTLRSSLQHRIKDTGKANELRSNDLYKLSTFTMLEHIQQYIDGPVCNKISLKSAHSPETQHILMDATLLYIRPRVA